MHHAHPTPLAHPPTCARSPSTPPSHHFHTSTNPPNLHAHPRPRLLINSFGYYDIGFRNPLIKTPTLDALVKNEAALLTRHYTFKYCSPTRRSFLVRCHVTTCDGSSGHQPLSLELSIAMQETAPSFEFQAGPFGWLVQCGPYSSKEDFQCHAPITIPDVDQHASALACIACVDAAHRGCSRAECRRTLEEETTLPRRQST
jgi:hypothetical protein